MSAEVWVPPKQLAHAYEVEGNLVTVRVPKRAHGDELAEVPYIHWREPGGWRPHVGQLPIWLDHPSTSAHPHHQKFLVAGSQGGKSNLGPPMMWRAIEENVKAAPLMEHAFGIIGPDLKMLRRFDVGVLRMVKFFEHCFGWHQDDILRLKDLTIDLTSKGWPVYIYSGSAERHKGIQGQRMDMIWIDEAGLIPRVAIYDDAMQRLRGKGDILITTTPYVAGQWLKTFLDEAREGDDDKLATVYASIVNPYFSLQQLEMWKKQLPPWLFRMRVLASWERPQGLVYEKVTYVEPFPIPRDWVRIIGIDPNRGGSDEFAVVWIAIDPHTGIWYVYRVYYKPSRPRPGALDQTYRSSQTLLEEAWSESVYESWCDDLGLHHDHMGDNVCITPTEERERISRIFYDPSAADLGEKLEEMFPGAEAYAAESTLAGIYDVVSVLQQGKLVVFDDLNDWRWEQENYGYPMDDRGEVTSEKPVDRNNHLMDATRYAVRQCSAARELAGFSIPGYRGE